MQRGGDDLRGHRRGRNPQDRQRLCLLRCTKSDRDDGVGIGILYDHYEETDKYCSGTSGCCLAPLASSGVPSPVEYRPGGSTVATTPASRQQTTLPVTDLSKKTLPVTVFVAEQGWIEEEKETYGFEEGSHSPRFRGQAEQPCKTYSAWSARASTARVCTAPDQGYACRCIGGYDGNPYLAGGCQGSIPLHTVGNSN
jgi:hypothetical protein